MTLAVNYIEEAIKLNPNKYLPVAKTDPDLERLRKNKRFRELIGDNQGR